MHIPEGFISPQTYLPIALIDGAILYGLFKQKLGQLNEQTLPFLALASAAVFILSTLMFPLPGGTSVHLVGVGIITALFGIRLSLGIFALTLLIQALLFGQGGISTYFINLFAIGVLGSFSAGLMLKLFASSPKSAHFLAGFSGVIVAALTTALILGLQPLIAHDDQGAPLFFPFGFDIVIPAILIPHLILAIIEGVLSLLLIPNLKTRMDRFL